MVWKKEIVDTEEVRSVASRYGVNLLTASVLVRRGVTKPEDVLFYLEKDLRYLHNPFLFVEMEDAVDRILQAKEEGEKVRIFGDRDVDGITSTVILMKTLRDLGLEVSYVLPEGNDSYGMTKKAVDDFAAEDGTLFVTTDCGISNIDEIEYAQSLGIDTIVTDHHNPPENLPPAVAIINPKLEESGYPFAHLAGCSVASKLAWALRFSQTELYDETVCLLNIRPDHNGTYALDAVKLQNLIEIDRITEFLVPGTVDIRATRLGNFLLDQAIYVYDAPVQEKMMRKIFGEKAMIGLIDTAPEIGKMFPSLEGVSLLRLREKSRMARYRDQEVSEIDVFQNLFESFIYRKFPSLGEGFCEIMDLVALGTLADMMPLRDENRILVNRGMVNLQKTVHPGLHALLFRQNLHGRKISTTDVGWQVTPLINATGRLGVPSKAANLLLAGSDDPVDQLVSEIVALNKQRKKLGENLWGKVVPACRKSHEEMDGKLVIADHAEMHRGITGIMAARLADYYKAPAIVVAHVDDKIVGSMRSYNGMNVKNFLGNFESFFTDYGGHDFAAGFNVPKERWPDLQVRIRDFVRVMESQELPEEVLEIDAELPKKYMTPALNDIVEIFEPYGEKNPALIFLVRDVKIQELDLVGRQEQQHVKMLIDAGAHKWPALFWRASDRVGRDFSLGDHVDMVFRLGRNYYQNRETLQLTVLDLKRR